jgi:hypothetical protein
VLKCKVFEEVKGSFLIKNKKIREAIAYTVESDIPNFYGDN